MMVDPISGGIYYFLLPGPFGVIYMVVKTHSILLICGLSLVTLTFLKIYVHNVSTAFIIGRDSAKSVLPPEGEDPHVLFDDLRYRRVCAKVHSSVLCLVIRFPYLMPLQNPNVTFPNPVNPHFYEIKRSYILNGDKLDRCQQESNQTDLGESFFWPTVHDCLEAEAARQVSNKTALALFTRRTAHSKGTELFGTGSQAQRNRAHRFFGNQRVVLLGASPTPGIANGISQLFDDCNRTAHFSWQCAPFLPNSTTIVDQSRKFELVSQYYHPKALPQGPDFHQTESIYSLDIWKTSAITIDDSDLRQQQREVTVVVDFPFAHAQTQDWLLYQHELVRYNHEAYVEHVLNITSAFGSQQLASKGGWKLRRMIAFDGLPQHFPTETNAYSRFDPKLSLEEGKIPGWREELGRSCVGPLPPNSPLKEAMLMARRTFERHEDIFDMNYYGRVWEYSNQYWWQMRGAVTGSMGWRFDCTHYRNPDTAEGWQVHKFFVQSMIDDHYEALQ